MICIIGILSYSQPNRQTLLKCYTMKSSLEFNKNLMQFIVHLDSANNSACNVFPIGVKANLSMTSPSFDNITIITSDFSYSQTSELLFEIPYALTDLQIQELETETLAYITIYSFSEISTTEIMIFDETLSQLSDCFSSINVTLQFSGFVLHLSPTEYCNNQMKLEASSPDNFIEQISLTVFESRYLIPTAQIVPHYNDQLITYQYIATDQVELTDLMNLQQQEFLTGTVSFESNQGGILVEFVFNLENIFYQTLQNVLVNPVVSTSENSFFVQIQEVNLVAIQAITGYTSYNYRLNLEKDGVQTQLIIINTSRHYQPQQYNEIIQFNCQTINEKMQKDCLTFYKFDQFDSIVLDLQFLKDMTLINHCKEMPSFMITPWDKAFVQVSKSQICVTPSAVTGITDYRLQYKQITLTNPIITGNMYCYQCSSQCKDFKQDGYYMFGDDQYVVITALLFKFEYSQVAIEATVIGIFFIAISLVYCVLQVLKTAKMIKQMKKKKNQVQ
ncbi:Conserved_hypothetical protein [Hexamita inflata]|uniref:Transmembrane protein n=1 Tax=Hexamita inflata TaxID=28002 RepID=A0AA86TYD6_9EUKA|nr:Conserved hypothetical protein [Hexamita inflata]